MQELQSIVKGRGGSGSLLDSLKAGSKGSPDIVQKGIIAPLTSSPQSSAFSKAPAISKAGGEPLTCRPYVATWHPGRLRSWCECSKRTWP